MGNKIDLCISYLPTGSCADCDESRPDVLINTVFYPNLKKPS